MSYSTSASGATKGAVRDALAAKMAEIVLSQPVHAKDQAAALATADTFLAMLPDTPPDGKQFVVSLSGSMSVQDADTLNASVSTSAYFMQVPVAA